MNNKIVLQQFSFVHEAQMAKARLEANGIKAAISDEHVVSMHWLYSDAIGGVKVYVHPKDEELAKAILAEDLSDLIDDAWELPKRQCLQCGCTDVESHTRGKRNAVLSLLLLGFPLFFSRRNSRHGYRCQSCKYFWQE